VDVPGSAFFSTTISDRGPADLQKDRSRQAFNRSVFARHECRIDTPFLLFDPIQAAKRHFIERARMIACRRQDRLNSDIKRGKSESVSDPPGNITTLLRDLRGGSREAETQLLELVYHELHRMAERLMRSERIDHTLHP
jgi:hypothetical protein